MRLGLLFVALLGPVSTLASSSSPQEPSTPYTCSHPPYTPQIISTSPLIIYLHNFTTPEERAHLRQRTTNLFSPSLISSPLGALSSTPIRTSSSTYIPHDPILSCIEARALAFQGHIPPSHLEPLQLVRYLPSQHYAFHTDWFANKAYASPSAGGNRLTSIFAYLYVSEDMVGGGTRFPMVKAKKGEEWCGILDCDAEEGEGVTFRAVEGNAVFWGNLREGGEGNERVIHAGLPVETGEKIGMNVWTREAPVGEEGRRAVMVEGGYPVL